MRKYFSSSKVEEMYEDIMSCIFSSFEESIVDYLFNVPWLIDPISYGKYIFFEFVKHSYDSSTIKYPLRHFLHYDATDDSQSDRMRYQRIMNYSQKYKDFNFDYLSKSNPNDLEHYKSMLKKDMGSIQNKLSGYEISEMTFFEFTTMMELPIIKSLTNHRLFNVHKVSNSIFIDLFKEYDSFVERLQHRSKQSDEDMVFASLAFFTLEWKYGFETIYLLATEMVKKGIDTLHEWTLNTIMGYYQMDSIFGSRISSESRMVVERQHILELLIDNPFNTEEGYLIHQRYAELVNLSTILRSIKSNENDVLYKDWFKNNTNMKDWAAFLREYNVFQAWHEKQWNNKTIRVARILLQQIAPPKL